jgi:NAD-dependent deacetylase
VTAAFASTPVIPPELSAALKRAKHVAVLTGAGVSAESGVPTFRDAQTGLWAKFRPEDLATPEAFKRNPPMVWQWYQERRAAIATVAPNPGHFALAQMQSMFERFTLITQNVDGLHVTAGSTDVIELHGNILKTKCFECNAPQEMLPDDHGSPPLCDCGKSFCRPDVVWFGEALPTAAIDRAQQAARECDVFFSIGTSTQVFPAADLPFEAKIRGAVVVEINPDETPLTQHADYVLRAPSGVALPLLLEKLNSTPA